MQTIGRRRIHASISYTTRPLNNGNKTYYDIIKALPFQKYVIANQFELFLKTSNDLDFFNFI